MSAWPVAAAVLGAVAAAAVGAGWVARRLVVVTVAGRSMEPTLRSGDRVLVRRTSIAGVRAGRLVVVSAARVVRTAAGPEWLVKRLAAGPGEPVPGGDGVVPADRMVLLGDNPAHSTDSRQVGYFTATELLGVVVRRMTPGAAPGRQGPDGTDREVAAARRVWKCPQVRGRPARPGR